MYKNFWYPMAMTEELADKPLLVRCMGLDFVVFRDTEGKAKCLSNTCIHRGGSLALGKMRGSKIACGYHGWQFDGAGNCHKIPSLTSGSSEAKRCRYESKATVSMWMFRGIRVGSFARNI